MRRKNIPCESGWPAKNPGYEPFFLLFCINPMRPWLFSHAQSAIPQQEYWLHFALEPEFFYSCGSRRLNSSESFFDVIAWRST
jgi:hypothetical protein